MPVNIYYPENQEVSSYDFPLGATIKVVVTGAEPTAEFIGGVTWSDPSIPDQSQTFYVTGGFFQIGGTAWWDITLPETACTGTITIKESSTILPLSGGTITIPIGVGTVPKATTTQSGGGNLLTGIEGDLKWLAIGAAGLLAVWLLSQLLPGIIKGTSKSAAEIASKKKS
jgi:hypothetical protein